MLIPVESDGKQKVYKDFQEAEQAALLEAWATGVSFLFEIAGEYQHKPQIPNSVEQQKEAVIEAEGGDS